MMAQRITNRLPQTLLKSLNEGFSALLLTIGEDEYPGTAFTWAVARSPSSLFFGVDHGSATMANLQRGGRAALQVINPQNQIFLIKGVVKMVKEHLEAIPFNMSMWELKVEEVKDQSWPGVSVHPLRYEWSPEQRLEMLAKERAVFEEMNSWTE